MQKPYQKWCGKKDHKMIKKCSTNCQKSAKNYQIPNKIILPPYTSIRLILKRNPINPFYWMNNKDITVIKNIENKDTNYGGTLSDILIQISDIYLQVERYKGCQVNIFPDKQLTYNYSYNKVDLVKLSSNTAQEYRLGWDGERIPEYAILYFLRDYDFIHQSSLNLTTSTDRFFLPKALEKIKISNVDWEHSTFDGLEIDHLNQLDRHPSKINYFHYLQMHKFLPQDLPYNEYFSESDAIKSGQLSAFPISIKGRNMPSSLLSRGFTVLLNFTNPLETNWYIAVRWVFCSTVHIERQLENLKIKFNN